MVHSLEDLKQTSSESGDLEQETADTNTDARIGYLTIPNYRHLQSRDIFTYVTGAIQTLLSQLQTDVKLDFNIIRSHDKKTLVLRFVGSPDSFKPETTEESPAVQTEVHTEE